MKTGTTSTGFHYEFDERRADDIRLVELIADTISDEVREFDKILAASKILTMLLGEEQKKALYEHIGQSHEDGRVPYLDLHLALQEIMQGGGESLKN